MNLLLRFNVCIHLLTDGVTNVKVDRAIVDECLEGNNIILPDDAAMKTWWILSLFEKTRMVREIMYDWIALSICLTVFWIYEVWPRMYYYSWLVVGLQPNVRAHVLLSKSGKMWNVKGIQYLTSTSKYIFFFIRQMKQIAFSQKGKRTW